MSFDSFLLSFRGLGLPYSAVQGVSINRLLNVSPIEINSAVRSYRS